MLIGVAGAGDQMALVYRFRQRVWRYEATLVPDGKMPAGFAAQVALANSSRAVVGSDNHAVIFHRNGSLTGWAENARLSYGGLGELVAAEDVTVVVSAYPAKKSVRVFRLIDDRWTTVASLRRSDGGGGDDFGSSVGISDGIVAVGAPGHAGGQGAVYVFAETPTGWAEQPRLMAGQPGAAFGHRVSIHRGTLVVGSQGTGAWCLE